MDYCVTRARISFNSGAAENTYLTLAFTTLGSSSTIDHGSTQVSIIGQCNERFIGCLVALEISREPSGCDASRGRAMKARLVYCIDFHSRSGSTCFSFASDQNGRTLWGVVSSEVVSNPVSVLCTGGFSLVVQWKPFISFQYVSHPHIQPVPDGGATVNASPASFRNT